MPLTYNLNEKFCMLKIDYLFILKLGAHLIPAIQRVSLNAIRVLILFSSFAWNSQSFDKC